MDYNIDQLDDALLKFTAKEIGYNATVVHFTEDDTELIEALKINDPKSHKLFIKNWELSTSADRQILSSHKYPKRCDRLKNPLVLRTIAQINGLQPEQRLAKTEHDKMYVIEAGGEKYNIPESRLKVYALALEEQREYLFRGSDDEGITFFWKNIQLPALHNEIMSKFYDFLYTGAFSINVNGYLSIYIDGEEFMAYSEKLQHNRHYFSCRYYQCNCIAFVTFDGKNIWIRVENHSPTQAHSHNDTLPYVHEKPVDVPKAHEPSRKIVVDSARLQPTRVSDASFKDAVVAVYTKKDVLLENATNFTFIPRGDRVNGCRVWRCSKNSKTRCIALAMTRKMRDGTERAIFDQPNVHQTFHGTAEKPAKTKQNFSKLKDTDFTDAVQIRPPPRGTKDRLTHSATNQLYYRHNIGKQHTSWHCQYKCKGCNGLFLTREIGGIVQGRVGNDHTRGCPLFVSPHTN